MIYIVKCLNYRIRRGVFETNSSSAHCFVLRKTGDTNRPRRLFPSHPPYIQVKLRPYRRDFQVLNTEYDKMSYLLTYVKTRELGLIDDEDASINDFMETEGYRILNEITVRRFSRILYPTQIINGCIDALSIDVDTKTLAGMLQNRGGFSAEEVIFNPKIEIWTGDDGLLWACHKENAAYYEVFKSLKGDGWFYVEE